MPRKDEALNEVLEANIRVGVVLDQMQAAINRHREVLGDKRFQELQDDLDRHRFDYELNRLVINAKLPKK